MRGAGRETAIPGCARAARHAYSDFLYDRLFGVADTAAAAHPDAGVVWRVSVYGRGLTEGSAVLRSHSDHVHAGQVPAGFHVLAPGAILLLFGNKWHYNICLSLGSHSTCSYVHRHPVCVPRLLMAHQDVLANLDSVPTDADRDDRHSQVTGHGVHAARAEDTGRHHAGDDQEGRCRGSASVGRRGLTCGGGLWQAPADVLFGTEAGTVEALMRV